MQAVCFIAESINLTKYKSLENIINERKRFRYRIIKNIADVFCCYITLQQC